MIHTRSHTDTHTVTHIGKRAIRMCPILLSDNLKSGKERNASKVHRGYSREIVRKGGGGAMVMANCIVMRPCLLSTLWQEGAEK